MTENPLEETQSQSSASDSAAELSKTQGELKPWHNFLIAFSFGALLSFVGLSISVDMAHVAIADVSALQWSGAISLPFILGMLGLILRAPFLDALETVSRLLPY